MKQFTIALLLFNFSIAAFSQSKESAVTKIYGQLATGGSNHNGLLGEISVQAVIGNKWVSTLSYQNIEADPKNLPENYKRGYTLLFLYDEFPATKMDVISLTGGRLFNMGRKTWATLEAGPSLVSGHKMSFTPQPVVTDGFFYTSSNYNVNEEEKVTTIGGTLKADFNWAMLPYVGLGFGAFANFNSIQSPVGGQIKLMIGWLNPKKKQSKG